LWGLTPVSPVEKFLASPVDRILRARLRQFTGGMRGAPPQLIVLANREPYRHENRDGRVVVERSASGVVNAVEPLLMRHSGVWVAEGVGEADRLAATDREGLGVPPDRPHYRLRRVWLSEVERHGYYAGFSNGALWPLCHRTSVEPAFYPTQFHAYELVNRRFADAVAEEATGAAPVVLVQDYHFALAPLFIRRQLPQSRIATFWHIPWPRPETFALCPWSRTLLEGLLGSSSIGLQTAVDRNHFLASVEQLLHADVDHDEETVTYKGRRVAVGVFPASIEWPGHWATESLPVSTCRTGVRQQLGLERNALLGIGVDRLDYTKGIEQKFLAVEWLLERRPDLVGRFFFVQLAEPSRESLPAYRHTRARVLETAVRINRRFSRDDEGPIRLIEAHHAAPTVARFFRAADFCYVGSLHDGMNLVSKEFVCARDDERGVLILSAFAGASHELTDAVIINPYDLDAGAAAIATALTMAPQEQRERMRRMRCTVARATAHTWAARILEHVSEPVVPRPVDSLRPSLSPLADLLTSRPLAASDASAS
jgi:trehalose 6-phosphate synthase